MKLLIFFVGFGLVTSCVSPGSRDSHSLLEINFDRSPANIEDFEGATDPQTLQDIETIDTVFGAETEEGIEDVKENTRRRWSQILKRSAAAASLMNDFDKKLESYFDKNGQLLKGVSFDLESNKVYEKLQRVRVLVHAVEFRAATVYAHLWKIYLNPKILKNSNVAQDVVKQRAMNMLKFVHAELNSYLVDSRVIGLFRMAHYLQDILVSLEENKLSSDPLYLEIKTGMEKIETHPLNSETVTYKDFIDLMKSVPDKELELLLKKKLGEREIQSNVVVAGFQNTTGSEFPANTWALTFDDGPSKTETVRIANILKQNNVSGTFFWLSKLVKTQPSIAKAIYDNGFSIASHSIDHSDLTKLSEASVKSQVSGSRDVIEAELHKKGAKNYKMKDFRCPYGACWVPKSQRVQQAIKDAGLRHVYWKVDTLDWQDKNTQSVLNRTLKQMKASGKGIILFHDIHPVAGNVLPLLLKDKYVIDNNIKFVGL